CVCRGNGSVNCQFASSIRAVINGGPQNEGSTDCVDPSPSIVPSYATNDRKLSCSRPRGSHRCRNGEPLTWLDETRADDGGGEEIGDLRLGSRPIWPTARKCQRLLADCQLRRPQ